MIKRCSNWYLVYTTHIPGIADFWFYIHQIVFKITSIKRYSQDKTTGRIQWKTCQNTILGVFDYCLHVQ